VGDYYGTGIEIWAGWQLRKMKFLFFSLKKRKKYIG
jgi:hypothetical protein